MKSRSDYADRESQMERVHFDFLNTELDTGLTLADLAETERRLGNQESAERALADAEKASATIQKFLPGADESSEDERRTLESKLEHLRDALAR